MVAVLGAAGFLLSSYEKVFATSSFDSLITTTSDLVIDKGDGVQPLDITNSYLSIMEETCNPDYTSFMSAINHSNGKWLISTVDGQTSSTWKTVRVSWITDPTTETVFETYNNGANHRIHAVASNSVYIGYYGWPTPDTVACMYDTQNSQITFGDDAANTWHYEVYHSTYPAPYPQGYAGQLIPGTSARDVDSDGDGLSDLIESPQYPLRNDIFCNDDTTSCAYPNPAVKDLYVEIDWMNNGSTTYKPNIDQVNLIKSGLDDIGYNVHVDTGQYGGGNALPDYISSLPMDPNASSTSFFDLKSGNSSQNIAANFNSNRKNIWRYVISGYSYTESTDSSGAAYPGSDNVFIAYGHIKDSPIQYGYTDLDTAIAGTTVHELGHSLCLDKEQSYSYHASECIFNAIDTEASLTYDSVMSYRLQMFRTNLSDGSNGTGDHDDWGAIDNHGLDDFVYWNQTEIDYSPGALHHGITTQEAQLAKSNGTLGKIKRGDKIYNYREKEVRDFKTSKEYLLSPQL